MLKGQIETLDLLAIRAELHQKFRQILQSLVVLIAKMSLFLRLTAVLEYPEKVSHFHSIKP